MKSLSDVLCLFAGEYTHWCPACKEVHMFAVDKPNSNGAKWTFDGNINSPSFSPSMNIRAEFSQEDGGPYVCHYFLKAGKIQFLDDCTHSLKGQTVDLPKLPPHLHITEN